MIYECLRLCSALPSTLNGLLVDGLKRQPPMIVDPFVTLTASQHEILKFGASE
jgi:hypothetical protein